MKETMVIIGALVLLGAAPVVAGGAWVPAFGAGNIQLGFSQKTADTSWTPQGDTRHHSSLHDFRYTYLGGEVGFGKGFSGRYLVLYLDGREGPTGDMERNTGLSELYLGLKYGLREGKWPLALAFNFRTSYLYDLPGPYDRHLFLPDEDDIDGDGDTEEALFKGVSPEWRGLLGEDYELSFLASRNVFKSGWVNMVLGYRYRTTNLADEIPFGTNAGIPLPVKGLFVKGTYVWVKSVGNYSTERDPEDRFGCSERNCFPDASYMVLGGSIFYSFGAEEKWWVEGGWNTWIWGRSSRKYQEPFLTVGRKF